MSALGLMTMVGVLGVLGPVAGPGAQTDCRMRLVAEDASQEAAWVTFQRVFDQRGYSTEFGAAISDGARAELSVRPVRSKCIATLILRWSGLDSHGNPMAVVDTVRAGAHGRRGCEKARVKVLGKLWASLAPCERASE